eukprot:6201055-Pleurochrysis_carterae.AAC.4
MAVVLRALMLVLWESRIYRHQIQRLALPKVRISKSVKSSSRFGLRTSCSSLRDRDELFGPCKIGWSVFRVVTYTVAHMQAFGMTSKGSFGFLLGVAVAYNSTQLGID